MGADFLFTMYEWPLGKTDAQTKKNLAKQLKDMRKRIDDEKPDKDGNVFGDLSEGREDLSFEDMKKELHEHVDVLEAECASPGREGCIFKNHEHMALITGGMSWGDAPTDLFDVINFLDMACVL